MNPFRMFFIQICTPPSNMHWKLTIYGRCVMQNNQHQSNRHVELQNKSFMYSVWSLSFIRWELWWKHEKRWKWTTYMVQEVQNESWIEMLMVSLFKSLNVSTGWWRTAGRCTSCCEDSSHKSIQAAWGPCPIIRPSPSSPSARFQKGHEKTSTDEFYGSWGWRGPRISSRSRGW